MYKTTLKYIQKVFQNFTSFFFVLNQLYIAHTMHVLGVSYIYQNFNTYHTNPLKSTKQPTYIFPAPWIRYRYGKKRWEKMGDSWVPNFPGSRTLSSSQPPRRLDQVPRWVASRTQRLNPMVFQKQSGRSKVLPNKNLGGCEVNSQE